MLHPQPCQTAVKVISFFMFSFSPQWAGRRGQQRQRTSRTYRKNRPHCSSSGSAFHHLYWKCTAPGPPPKPDLRTEKLDVKKVKGRHDRRWSRERRSCLTWEDKEDSRDKCQDGAVRADVADVVEDKTDEHEEEADQRERSGWTDHLWRGG